MNGDEARPTRIRQRPGTRCAVALRGQLRIALNSGATKEEIVETFIQIAADAGVARAFDGFQVATEVFAERAARD